MDTNSEISSNEISSKIKDIYKKFTYGSDVSKEIVDLLKEDPDLTLEMVKLIFDFSSVSLNFVRLWIDLAGGSIPGDLFKEKLIDFLIVVFEKEKDYINQSTQDSNGSTLWSSFGFLKKDDSQYEEKKSSIITSDDVFRFFKFIMVDLKNKNILDLKDLFNIVFHSNHKGTCIFSRINKDSNTVKDIIKVIFDSFLNGYVKDIDYLLLVKQLATMLDKLDVDSLENCIESIQWCDKNVEVFDALIPIVKKYILDIEKTERSAQQHVCDFLDQILKRESGQLLNKVSKELFFIVVEHMSLKLFIPCFYNFIYHPEFRWHNDDFNKFLDSILVCKDEQRGDLILYLMYRGLIPDPIKKSLFQNNSFCSYFIKFIQQESANFTIIRFMGIEFNKSLYHSNQILSMFIQCILLSYIGLSNNSSFSFENLTELSNHEKELLEYQYCKLNDSPPHKDPSSKSKELLWFEITRNLSQDEVRDKYLKTLISPVVNENGMEECTIKQEYMRVFISVLYFLLNKGQGQLSGNFAKIFSVPFFQEKIWQYIQTLEIGEIADALKCCNESNSLLHLFFEGTSDQLRGEMLSKLQTLNTSGLGPLGNIAKSLESIPSSASASVDSSSRSSISFLLTQPLLPVKSVRNSILLRGQQSVTGIHTDAVSLRLAEQPQDSKELMNSTPEFDEGNSARSVGSKTNSSKGLVNSVVGRKLPPAPPSLPSFATGSDSSSDSGLGGQYASVPREATREDLLASIRSHGGIKALRHLEQSGNRRQQTDIVAAERRRRPRSVDSGSNFASGIDSVSGGDSVLSAMRDSPMLRSNDNHMQSLRDAVQNRRLAIAGESDSDDDFGVGCSSMKR